MGLEETTIRETFQSVPSSDEAFGLGRNHEKAWLACKQGRLYKLAVLREAVWFLSWFGGERLVHN